MVKFRFTSRSGVPSGRLRLGQQCILTMPAPPSPSVTGTISVIWNFSLPGRRLESCRELYAKEVSSLIVQPQLYLLMISPISP